MAKSSTDTDGIPHQSPTASRRSATAIDLKHIVVRYDDRSDRCTVTPRDCSDANRLTTWLSADIDAFVDLEAVR